MYRTVFFLVSRASAMPARRSCDRLLFTALVAVVMVLALVGASLALPNLPAAEAQEPVTVRLEPAAANGAVDDVFTVQVYVDNAPATGVQGWEVSISFDPAVVRLQPGQSNTTYFVDNIYDGPGYNAFPVAAPAATSITLGQVLLGVPSAYPSGSDLLLATIQWQAVADGASALDINSVQIIKDALAGETYAPLTEIDGQALVGGAAPLTPTTAPPAPAAAGAPFPTTPAIALLAAATPTPESIAVGAPEPAPGDASPSALPSTTVLVVLAALAAVVGGIAILARRRTR
jgi:hypothetical protein